MSDYRTEADKLLLLASAVLGWEIDTVGLIEVSARADSVGPILDPTAWQRSKHDHRKVARLARALVDFRAVAREVVGEAVEQNAPPPPPEPPPDPPGDSLTSRAPARTMLGCCGMHPSAGHATGCRR